MPLAGACASVPVAAQTTIKIGYATTATSHYGVGSTAFCDDLEKRTSGRYKCQQFANSALGGEREMIEAVQLGTLDVVNTSTGPVGNFVPEVNIVDIPFLFRDYDHARKAMDGQIGQELLAKFPAKGLVAIAWTENGFRHMTNSKRPINKPDDVKGLKIRTMQNKVHIQAFQSIGIQPTPMAFPELFTALQQGTVDGQENPDPGHPVGEVRAGAEAPLADRPRVFAGAADRLPGAVEQAVGRRQGRVPRGGQGGLGRATQEGQRRRADGIAQLRAGGMEVVTNVDGTAFRNAMTPVWSEFAKQYGAENIKRIQDVR